MEGALKMRPQTRGVLKSSHEWKGLSKFLALRTITKQEKYWFGAILRRCRVTIWFMMERGLKICTCRTALWMEGGVFFEEVRMEGGRGLGVQPHKPVLFRNHKNVMIYDWKGPENLHVLHRVANGRGCLFQRSTNGRGRGSEGPASHTRTFPDLVPPPPRGTIKPNTFARLNCQPLGTFSFHNLISWSVIVYWKRSKIVDTRYPGPSMTYWLLYVRA